MGVDDGPHVGVLLVNTKVHLRLGGGLAGACQDVPVQVQLHQHVLGHEALGDAGGGDPEGVLAHADGEVAVVGGHQPPLIDPETGLDDLGLGLGVGGIGGSGAHAFAPFPGKRLAKLSAKGG